MQRGISIILTRLIGHTVLTGQTRLAGQSGIPCARLAFFLLLLISVAGALGGCAGDHSAQTSTAVPTSASAPSTSAGGGNIAVMNPKDFLMATIQFFCMALIVYFLLVINPQRAKEESHSKFLEALKKNDEVVTSGGVLARVVSVKPDFITLEISPNVKIKVEPKHVFEPRRGEVGKAAVDSEDAGRSLEAENGREAGKKKK